MGRVRGAARAVARTLREQASWVDASVASAASVAGVAGLPGGAGLGATAAAAACTLAATTSVSWRSRAPEAAVVVTGAGLAGCAWAGDSSSLLPQALCLLLVSYSAGARGISRRQLVQLAVLVTYGIGACTLVAAATSPFSVSAVAVHALPIVVAPAAAGLLVARQRALAGRLAAATERLRAEEGTRLAVVAIRERNRVARELHDIVAHGVSVMVVQAGAARITAAEEPDVARAALGEVTGAGRAALSELRRIVGVVGSGSGDDDEAGPPSGVSGIVALAERRRAGGLPVRVTVTGTDPGLPGGVGIALYRLVQEALTNVVKHARSAATEVDVVIEPGTLRVRVRNGAPGADIRVGTVTLAGAGRGIAGMRERVSACGGQLRYGAQTDGGFAVLAEFPLPTEAVAVLPAGGVAQRITALLRAAGPWAGVIAALGAGCADAYLSKDRTGPLALNVALVVGMSLALVWRRRKPLAFLIAVNLLALPVSDGLTSINNPTLVSTYVFAVPVWAVAAWSAPWTAACGLVLTVGFDAGEGLYWHLGWGAIVPNVLIAGALWTAGRVLRAQRLMAANLRRAGTALEAEQRAREALTLAEERTRLITRMHTLVAEQVRAMIVTAESVLDLVGIDADTAASSIGEIERTGRQSLTQLREILGVLRSEYDPDPLPS